MTITLYLDKTNFLADLTTLKTIFDVGVPELVIPLRGFLNPLSISSSITTNGVAINVTLEEFALIEVFNNGI